jgi:hypothetical protein
LAAVTISVLTAFGCEKGPPPRKVMLEVPDQLTTTAPAKVAISVRTAEGALETRTGSHDFQIQPEAIATVAEDGQLKCLKSGDAKLSLTIRGVTGTADVRCRIVKRLELRDPGEVDISKQSIHLSYTAYSEAGKPLDDVPVELLSKNPNIVRVKGQELELLAVGEAKLTVRAGDVEERVTVRVVRELKPEALPMNDNRRINFSLKQGKYQIVVELARELDMTMEWRGAPYCDYKGHGKLHRVECVMRSDGGGVVIDNPAFLESGSTDVSHRGVRIHEIP